MSRLRVWSAAVLAVVAVAGAVLSFDSLHTAAVPTFDDPLAYGFPLLVDALILGASLQFIAGARAGQPQAGWRLTAHAGVAGTIALNALAAPTMGDIPWHVTAPIVWSVLVELTARTVLGEWRAEHKPPLDRVPARLWVTAPVESARVWLRLARRVEGDQAAARLEVGAYAAAVEALRASIPGREGRAARRILQRQLRAGTLPPGAVLAACGWLDPTSGPRAPQAVLRAALGAALGQDEAGQVTVEVQALDLGPEAAQQVPAPALEATVQPGLEAVCADEPAPEPSPEVEVPAPGSSPEVEVPEPPRVPVAAARRARAVVTAPVEADPEVPAPDLDDPLWLAAVKAAADLTRHGDRITRTSIANALRDAGHHVSNVRAGELARQLKAHGPDLT